VIKERHNGVRYLRWGGDGEAVQPEKSSGVGKGSKTAQNPQRQVHALLGGFVQDAPINNQNHHQHAQVLHITLILAKAENRTCQNAK